MQLSSRAVAHGIPAIPDAPGDAELLRATAAGDAAALGALYDRHVRQVWRAVDRTLIDKADVEDVVHTVFLKLPQIARSYDGRASCRAWLCAIAMRVAMRHRRGVGRFRRLLDTFAETFAGATWGDPERHAIGRDEVEQLERALGCLSEKKRAVYVMVDVQQFAPEEAARALGIPAATARTRLHHARREMQVALLAGARSQAV